MSKHGTVPAIHPVIELMRQRKAENSKPGQRGPKDTAKLAIVIEGGGMRGIVSGGMTAAIEQLGFLDTIDVVYGTSAGALNGAFLLSGQATWSCTIYYDYLNKERFIDLNRLLLGKPAIDMEYLKNDVYARERKLDYQAIINNPIAFHCMATEIKTGQTRDLTDFKTREDIESALLATSRIPFAVGDPHEHNEEKYVDAGMSDPIPLEAAITDGATHVLVLQTRPADSVVKATILDPIIERYLQQISPALEDIYEERIEKYKRTLEYIEKAAHDLDHQPAICNVQLASRNESVGTLEKDTAKLVEAAGNGLKTMYELLTGEPVVFEQVITAFPAAWYDATRP